VALTDLHLSPFPALVIGVEGATEFGLVPRVMDLLGIQQDRNRIAIVELGIDPGPALRELHRRILQADGRLLGVGERPRPGAGPGGSLLTPLVRPADLPALHRPKR
jgi:hypothetical protein